MKSTQVWVTRDANKDYIKIWAKEPVWVATNRVWTGKDYLGICCLEEWPGPDFTGSGYDEYKMKVAVLNSNTATYRILPESATHGNNRVLSKNSDFLDHTSMMWKKVQKVELCIN